MTNNYTLKSTSGTSSFRRWIVTTALMFCMFLLNQTAVQAQALCGPYTVGSGGAYGSLSAAFTDLNLKGASCSVVFEMLPTYTSALEPGFPINTGVTAGVGAGVTVTVRPQAGSGVLIITSASLTGTIVENTSQYVIFDGRPGGVGVSRNLIIENTAAASTGTVVLLNDASHNTFQYCSLTGVATAVTAGVVNIGLSTTGTTGNDFNLIDNCDIGNGLTNPANGVVALGTATKENDNNTISNCNIFNYHSTTVLSKGVSVGANNTAWTITANRFYQTASRVYFAGQHIPVSVAAPTGSSFVISNNIIGFANSAGTGNYAIATPAAAARFVGISLAGLPAGTNTISGNQISNITITTTDASVLSAALSGTFCGIATLTGSVSITGNTIGSASAVDNILVTTSGSGSNSAGIYAASTNPALATMSANNIGGISVIGTTNAIGVNLRGIYTAGSGFRVTSLNTIGSTSATNSLRAGIPGGTGACSIVGIEYLGTNVNSITNNTIANILANGGGAAGQVIGIQATTGTNTITLNTIRNLVNSAANAAGSGNTGAAIGINITGSTGLTTVSQNTIYSLSSTAATAAVTVTGINFAGAISGHVVSRNLIHSLTASTSGTALIIGSNSSATGSVTFQNNMVRLGTDITSPYTIVGFNKTSAAASATYLHNSVYIGGSVASGAALTSAFRRPTTPTGTDDIKNNIFYNARINTGGTGSHYAMNFLATAFLSSDKNILLVDTLQGGQTGAINAVNSLNLASWKLASGQDVSSLADDPKYIAPNGLLTAVDLHIQASPVPTPIEAAGTLASTVADDFDGQTRASFSPVDIGADAGDFTSLGDFVGPIFASITPAPGSSCTAVSHIITAVITDASGVASATFNYTINNAAQAPIVMVNVGGNNWQVTLPANGNAIIAYTITAVDASVSANISISATNSYQDDYLGGGLSAGPDVSICLLDSTTLTVFRTVGNIVFTEITGEHTGNGVGVVAPGIGGGDFIELTNVGSIPVDISGWKLEITGTSAGSINFPAGNVIPGGKTFVISRGAGGTANIPGVYLDGSSLLAVGQASTQGFILSNGFGQIVDVAAINGYNVVGTGFPVVTATDWSGLALSQGVGAGIRRTVATDNNLASDWTVASVSNITNFGAINTSLTVATSPSIVWSPGGSTLSTIRVSPAATTTYTATVTDGICSAADQVIVNILPLPNNVTTNNGLHCGNKIPLCSINALPGAVSYDWYDAPTGGTLLQSSPSLTYLTAINATTTFYVRAFDGSCSGPVRVPVTETVAIPPVVAAQANDSAVCEGTVITLTALSANPGYVYTWSAVGGNLQSFTGTVVTAQPLAFGSIQYIVSAVDPADGCDYIDTVIVAVAANPVLNPTTTANIICESGSAILNAGTPPPGLVYNITSVPATLVAPTGPVTPTVSGDDVIAPVTMPWNFTFFGVSSNIVNVCTNGVVEFGTNSGVIVYGSAIPNVALPNNIAALVWEDLNPVAGQINHYTVGTTPNRKFVIDYNGVPFWPSGGFVKAQMVLSEFDNSVTMIIDSIDQAGNFNSMGVENAAGTVGYVPVGRAFGTWGSGTITHEAWKMTPQLVGATPTWAWSPSTYLNTTTGQTVIVSPTAPGNITYTVTATDPIAGCTTQGTIAMTFNDAPEAPTCSGATVCGQGNVTLNATAAAGGNSANLMWTPGLGGKVLGNGPSLTQYVSTSGSAVVREIPSTAVSSNIGFVGTGVSAAGFFPTTTQGLWFKVNSGNGVLINTVDIYPNGPIGSTLTIAIRDTNGVVIGTATTVTTVTNVSTAPTLNYQTVNIGIFVPYSPNAYSMSPTQNPNLAAHNVGVTGSPWIIAGELHILGYGNMAPAPSIFANTVYGFFYNWNVTTGCFGDICTAPYTVTTPPALTITPSGPTAYCGTGSVGLTAGGSPSWTNFTWSPATGLSGTTGATVTASPTVTTTYTVLASDGILNGCVDTAQVTVTVNVAPFVTAGTAPSDTICNQTSFQFSAQGGSPSFKFLGTTQNPGQATGSIFNGANLTQRSQTLITAAELNAAGLIGPSVINSVGFFVNNKLSTQPYTNFTVKMAVDANTCWTSTTPSTTPATTVFAGNYSTVAGWNDIIFTTPYVWDGISNIMLETCFANGTTSFFDIVYTSTTPCNQFLATNAEACGSTFSTLLLERPNMRFTGGVVSFSWSPATDLSATNIKNPVYTPTSVGAKSYTVTVTDPVSGCTASSTLNFYVNTKPKVAVASFANNNSEICVSGTKTMSAITVDGNKQWQVSNDGITFTDIPGATLNTYTTGTITLDTYYRLKNYCSDSSYSNILFLNVQNPSLLTSTPGTRCGQGLVNLSATAAAGYYTQWFADSTSFTPLWNQNNFSPFITQTDTFWVTASVDTVATFAGGPAPTYCAITNAGSSCITNVLFGTMNFAGVTCVLPSNTVIVPEATATAQVIPGQTVPLTVTCDGTAIMSVWIDYNRDGVFDASEWQQITTTLASATISVTIPGSATPGKTGMRIRSRLTGNQNGPGDACLAMGSGSSADFTITIGAPSCSSARVPVIATSVPATAISATPATVNLCGTTGSATLTVSSGAGSYDGFSWSPSTGLNTTTGTSVIASPTVSTTYIVTATNSVNGCATSDTVVVTVTPAPIINAISATPNPLCFNDSAQITVSAIPFIPSSGQYNVASIPFAPIAGTMPNTGLPAGDEGNVNAALGFNFNYYGTVFTDVTIHANGQVLMGANNASANNVFSPSIIPTAAAPNNWVGFWSDLNTTATNVTWGVVGTAPFRKLVVNFTNVDYFSATPFVTFQTVLNETTNTIDVHMVSTNGLTGNTRAIGVEDATGTLGTAAPGRNGGLWSATNESWQFSPPIPTSLTYAWTPPAGLNNASISDPKASPATNTNYTVVVTETSTGCTASASILISKSVLPTAKIIPGDTTLCFPDVVYLKVIDTLNYAGGYPAGTTIDWIGIVNGLSPTDSIASSNGNQYQVQVNLPTGCNSVSAIRTITTQSVTVVPTIIPATCGANNGSVTATITNGFPPFNYVWTDGVNTIQNVVTSSTTNAISGLAPGTYYLSVFDNIGNVGTISCNSGLIPFVVPAPPPVIVSITKTDISCNGNGDGSATVSASGGSGGFSYLWSTGSTQTVIGGLTAATYTVTATDMFGCTGTGNVTIIEPAAISVVLSQTPATCNGGLDGTASAVLSGGTAPLVIDWFEGINFVQVGSGLSLTGVPPGLYFAVVNDSSGCQQFSQITILEPAPIVVSLFTPASGGVGTPVTVTGSGFVNVTDVKFNGISATFTVVNTGQINTSVPAGATTGPITVITNNLCTGVSSGSFIVISTATVNVKAFIEGYYTGGGLMTTVLINQGIATGPADADSVTIQLRDQFSPATVVSSSTVMLHTNGTANVTIPGGLIGSSYYIAVLHRNAVQTWSALPVTISGTTNYDFTTGISQSYGSNQKDVGAGVWAFFSGDITPQDEFVDASDLASVDNDASAFAFGYFATDVNGDGFSDASDLAVVDNNSTLFVFSAHP